MGEKRGKVESSVEMKGNLEGVKKKFRGVKGSEEGEHLLVEAGS